MGEAVKELERGEADDGSPVTVGLRQLIDGRWDGVCSRLSGRCRRPSSNAPSKWGLGAVAKEAFEARAYDVVVAAVDRSGIDAVDAVVFECVGKVFRVGQVVDRHNIVLPVQLGNAGDGSADSSEAIDGDAGR